MPPRPPGILGVSLRGRQPPLPVLGFRARSAALASNAEAASAVPETQPVPPARWVSDVRTRIGKCIMFGCDTAQTRRAAAVLATLASEWRVLSAESEGFLVAGLEGQKVVWGEMDSFGHVNNAAYIRYAESARVNWILHFAAHDPAHREAWCDLMRPRTIGLIMKSIKADYKFPMTAPDSISVYPKLSRPPEATHTSLMLDCVVFSHRHRRIAARTAEEISLYDYRAATKTVLPTFMLDVLRDAWRRQQERTDLARARIWDLLARVEGLEKETWDREDAVEDLGAAGKGV
ncbi:thioesterase-like superfamily-domain-containing protein [Nemania sp. FL0916]|nr:thioesterase-like superfamily-domain-containing protein [Nemania sp. FL0916]